MLQMRYGARDVERNLRSRFGPQVAEMHKPALKDERPIELDASKLKPTKKAVIPPKRKMVLRFRTLKEIKASARKKAKAYKPSVDLGLLEYFRNRHEDYVDAPERFEREHPTPKPVAVVAPKPVRKRRKAKRNRK